MKKSKMKKKMEKQRRVIKELRFELNSLWEQQLSMLCFLESRQLLSTYLELFSEEELPFK